ncbi:YceI family protein [Pannonibacter phragmitetus]|nr:YceI family protein [Pannonibacter phragmitetus]
MRKTFAAAFTAASLILASGAAYAAEWTVDPANSSIGFTVEQDGAPVSGSFGTWTAQIDFDPENVSAAKIEATIATGSAQMANAQFAGMLPGADWLATEAFPEARFTSTSVTAKGGNAYEAEGTLSLRGEEKPVTLAFTLDITGDTAVAKGTASLSRSAYGIGASVGQDNLKDAVAVTIDLTATR